jgi:hypothetical protein
MQRLQLYIEDNVGNYPLVDLFDDESVQLTSTIQDVRDIGKVFTDYSQTFTVPASETNNKIFRHYYNYYITGNAYDSRKKKNARLEINYLPFRRGKIFLNSVKMKMNKAYAYELIFYGETVSLKDLIGDDELTDLAINKADGNSPRYLSNYNHEYNEVNVKSGATNGIDFLIDGVVQEEAIIYPLITSKKRLYFHSATPDYNADGNIYHNTSNPDQDVRGLKFTDLKPAIKSIHIIEAIESVYGVSFTRDFFDSDAFSSLYLWINSKKGEFNDLSDDEEYLFSYFVDGYTEIYGNQVVYPEELTIVGSDLKLDITQNFTYKFELDVSVSNQNVDYDIILRNKTKGIEYKKSFIGNNTFLSEEIDFILAEDTDGDKEVLNVFEFEIRSKESLTINPTEFRIYKSYANYPFDASFYTTTLGQVSEAQLLLQDRLPKMKVIDFLTGLFKMFNLTAYYIDDPASLDDGKIYVDTLDNYYSDAVNNKLGGLIDLDKYLDVTEHTVNSVLPFTDINFNYQDTKVVLMENHFEQFNEVFGDAEFNVRNEFLDEVTKKPLIDRGTKYNIEIPFSHMKYERLLDLNTSSTAPTRETLIQWGYCASGDFSPDENATPAPKGDYDTTTIKPLLFHAVNVTDLPEPSGSNSFRDGRINWISTSPPTPLTSYWRPSNSLNDGTPTVAPSYSLNFDNEFDEWQRIDYGEDSNSLYSVFYKSYVESVFNPAKRMFKVTAYLPPNILINYRLNDQIKIQDKIFRINSITTNLMDGKSELELLNIFSNEIVE